MKSNKSRSIIKDIYAKKVLLVADWEDELKKYPQSNQSFVNLEDPNNNFRIKMLEEANRKLKTKNLILKTQIVNLEEELTKISVI